MKRVALLTGASGLLGTAFIERYSDKYEIVAVHHHNPIEYATQEQSFVDPLNPAEEIGANNQAVYSIRADLSRPDEIDPLINEVLSRFGGVDLLINGAAIYAWSHLLAPTALDQAETVLAVNLMAPLRIALGLAQKYWRLDPDANQRSNRNIVNISSTSGLYVYAESNLAMYATSKAALNHLTYHLACDFWDIGIRVNALAPDTFPLRIATERVVQAIVDLDNSDQTGQVIPLLRTMAIPQSDIEALDK